MGRPVPTPLGTDNCEAKLTREVANEMQNIIRRSNSETKANMLWRDGLGRVGEELPTVPGTNRSDGRSTYNRKQRNFTCSVVLMHQQNQRQERDRQMEKKNHVKPRIFISRLVEVKAAKFLL